MAKKKSDKETEPKKVSTKRFSAFLKNETTHFVIGLISVIFAVYLLLAFTSFFFTGAADQSILDNQQPGELMQSCKKLRRSTRCTTCRIPYKRMFRLSCLFYHFIPGRSGYEINESLPVPYLEMVYVLFYPAHLVLYHIGIYF